MKDPYRHRYGLHVAKQALKRAGVRDIPAIQKSLAQELATTRPRKRLIAAMRGTLQQIKERQ